jgi:putative transposase
MTCPPCAQIKVNFQNQGTPYLIIDFLAIIRDHKSMARIARVIAEGYPHYITQHGNRRLQTFFNDGDYQEYLRLMAEWLTKRDVTVWAYCLLPNHVHLLAVPNVADGLRRGIGEAHRRYSRLINLREGWRGHLWQGRFSSFVLDRNHLLAAARYIERNPVAAGLVKKPWDYRWSSARAHVGGQDDILVRVKPLLKMVDDWRDFIRQQTTQESIRAFQRHGRTGRPLGDKAFVEKVEIKTRRDLKPKKPGPKGPSKLSNKKD